MNFIGSCHISENRVLIKNIRPNLTGYIRHGLFFKKVSLLLVPIDQHQKSRLASDISIGIVLEILIDAPDSGNTARVNLSFLDTG